MNILNEIFNIYEEENNSKSVNDSWKKCKAGLNFVPEDSIGRIENLIHNYAGECEKVGFRDGFYYGVQLIIKCVSKSGASGN